MEKYIKIKSGGIEFIIDRYKNAIEEIITINELKLWLEEIDNESVDEILKDIDLYYKLELHLPLDE